MSEPNPYLSTFDEKASPVCKTRKARRGVQFVLFVHALIAGYLVVRALMGWVHGTTFLIGLISVVMPVALSRATARGKTWALWLLAAFFIWRALAELGSPWGLGGLFMMLGSSRFERFDVQILVLQSLAFFAFYLGAAIWIIDHRHSLLNASDRRRSEQHSETKA